MNTLKRAALTGLTVLPLGCSGSDVASNVTVVHDSAGIRVVDNAVPSSPNPWIVGQEPNVVIGGIESDSTQQLFRVAGAVSLSDGRIVIAHGPAPMLRWYDGSGSYQMGTGRPGGGPGEFGGGESAWISMIWPMAGDSVATWEHAPRRMQVFSPEGKFVRSIVLDLPPNMPVRSYPQVIGRMSDGFVAYLSAQREPGTLGEVVRDSFTYIRFLADGSYAGEIARLPGFTSYTYSYRSPDGRQFPASGRPPFATLPVVSPGDDRLYYGSGDHYEIGVYDSVGSLHTLVRKPGEARAVTAELIQTYKSETMTTAPNDPAGRRLWEEILNDAPYPETLPAYRRARVDRLDLLWVQQYDTPGADSVAWSVFDPEGRWLSQVTVPKAWQILDIGEDHILVLARDELDVERVQRYPLVRR